MTPFHPAVPSSPRRRLLTRCAAAGAAVAGAALLAACAQPAPAPHPGPMPLPPPSPGATSPLAQQLTAYQWDLQAARHARGQDDTRWRVAARAPLRLSFQDGRVAVHNLCNVVGGDYQLNGTQLRIGRTMSTMRACAEPGLMALEQRVGQQLPTVQSAAIQASARAGGAPQLMLRFADGSQWQLAGQATPQTRYGAPGERLFLEVAPHKVACNHPLMRNATCLRVRDVRYDANGLNKQYGAWRVFQGSIEGFEHRAGMRQILRVDRYSLARNGQLPADGPRHAYVLDMVVESEAVR